MYLSLDEVIEEAKCLPIVPLIAAKYYRDKIPSMRKYVDETLSANESINDLIGNNPLQVMFDNHNHHSAFMGTVFTIGNYELLARIVAWVYRAYSAHNFSYDYTMLELNTWIEAIDIYIASEMSEEIKTVYRWMIKIHEDMILISQSLQELEPPVTGDWLERKNSFLSAILTGEHRTCLEIASQSISTGRDVVPFYLHIIQPVMYEVGILWERGRISVAQEHLASAIVGRVMATTSMTEVTHEKVPSKAVITSAPNEFHEIGAWMISDIFEHQGWNVRYLGANTPMEDLIVMLHSFQPDVLALSVTMPFNILNAEEIVAAIKQDEELSGIRIVVGGRAFSDTDELWRSTGADYYAANAQQLKALLGELE